MRFAENGRISHRQLYRQMILGFLAPFLLYFPGRISGINGVAGIAVACIILLFYMVFLVRFSSDYDNPEKNAGVFIGKLMCIFLMVYVIFAGAYLLSVLAEIVPKSLVSGVSGEWIALAAVLVCGIGTDRGMQRRGRMAEVSGGFLLFGILLMTAASVSQGRLFYLREMLAKEPLTVGGTLGSAYEILCGFSALGLLPFLMENVEKHGSAGKTTSLGIVTISAILAGLLLLIPASLGTGRMKTEKYPVLPLLAGAALPGNVLARFDVLWLGFLLYSLLFAIGSLLHYGNLIMEKGRLGKGRFLIPAAIYLAAAADIRGADAQGFFGVYLRYIFLPGLVLLQLLVFFSGRKHRRRRAAAALSVMALGLFLGGCSAAVEPEKRAYPLALGIDASGDELIVTYGMPNLAKATGQEKGEDEEKQTLRIAGRNFGEIETLYNRSQEKLLDMGHLEILVLGEELIEGGRFPEALAYLKEQPFVGEDMYVFRTRNAGGVLEWKGGGSTSAGEYLEGMMENRMKEQRIKRVTLRDVFYEWYERGGLCALPEIYVTEEELLVGEAR